MSSLGDTISLAKDILSNVDWKRVGEKSDILPKLMMQKETWVLLNSAADMRGPLAKVLCSIGEMRDPLAKVLLSMGEITEEEAGAEEEGGLGLVELARRAVVVTSNEG